MENSKLKNMVVLKNLPSNLVEEAIVILKSNKKVKKLQKIEKNNANSRPKRTKGEKDYILKEAEMLVSNYISKLENDYRAKELKRVKASQKYKRLRNYAYLSSFIVVIESVLLFT